ncbi:MAG: radical SAM protein [Archaeoglobaceae archaeon]
MKIAILDGYVDEPSCLGVPPFISPYPRYIVGMVKAMGYNASYITADQLRSEPHLMRELEEFDLIIVIAGAIVPGKYLSARPLSFGEIRFLPEGPHKIVVGPIALELDNKRLRNYNILEFPFEKQLHAHLSRLFKGKLSFDLPRFAIEGAEVIERHPDFPHIICEIETYRGCYWGKCSFCMERTHGKPQMQMREPEDVLNEIEALYNHGARYFRIGKQTDFFTYRGDFSYEVPKPDPEFMLSFHREIWRRCPKIKTLHFDNLNPKTIATHPRESKEIIKTIIVYHTPGNVAAMGLETADEKVAQKNNLAATPQEVMYAIKLINKFGASVGYNGLPYFLPGLNFVAGLWGETKDTYKKNLEFLRQVLEQGLLLRRINIRQVKLLRGSPLAKNSSRVNEKYFNSFKRRVRKEIDREILKKAIPVGRKLTDLRCEVQKGNITFARQMATYPLLVGVVGSYERNDFIDVRVTGHGERSITGVKYPMDVNTAESYQLENIPGIGRKTALKLMSRRPYESLDELQSIIPQSLVDYFTVS